MITGFRLRRNDEPLPLRKMDATRQLTPDESTAKERVIARLRLLGSEQFDAMSEDEYGEWLNGLPQDEFIALIMLAEEEKPYVATQPHEG